MPERAKGDRSYRRVESGSLRRRSERLEALRIQGLGNRLGRLEAGQKKSSLKAAAENVAAVALFLGLVLTSASLYDVFVTKPAAARVTAISQFNMAVNAAAEVRVNLEKATSEKLDPMARFRIMGATRPQILNNIATARAILPSLRKEDVGVPQLMILAYEAHDVGDLSSASDFIELAVAKEDAVPVLRAQALSYKARHLFLLQRVAEGRKEYRAAVDVFSSVPGSAGARVAVLMDWTGWEYILGDCTVGRNLIIEFKTAVDSPEMNASARFEYLATIRKFFETGTTTNCPAPSDLEQLLGGVQAQAVPAAPQP